MVEKLSVGRPEDNCDITPVISETSANFIEGLAMDAKNKGATFLTEFKRWGVGEGGGFLDDGVE